MTLCDLQITLWDGREVRQTATFSAWLTELGDEEARARILATGPKGARSATFGKHRRLTKKSERVEDHYGPGYRVYFAKRGRVVVTFCVVVTSVPQDADIRGP